MKRSLRLLALAPFPNLTTRAVCHLCNPLYRNAYALMFNTVATSGLGVVYWVLAARIYPPETVGLNATLLSAMIFLAGLAQLNLKGVLIRFLPIAASQTPRLILASYLISIALALLLGALFVIGIGWFAPALNELRANPLLGVWFIASAMTWCIFALQDNVLTGLRQTHWVPFENTLFALAKIILLVLLATPWLADYSIFASWTLPVLLAIVPINILIFRRLLPRNLKFSAPNAPPIEWRALARYVGGDYVGSLFALALVTALPLLVTQHAGAAANAYFYLAWVIASSLQLLNINLATSFTVEAAAQPHDLGACTRRFLRHAARLQIPLTALLILVAPFVLQLFGRAYADEGVTLLRLLAFAALPHLVNALFISIARVQRRVRVMALTQAAQCALGLALSFLFLRAFGIVGVGIGLVISESLIAAFLLFTQIIPLLKREDYP